jgi:hypothetical protein
MNTSVSVTQAEQQRGRLAIVVLLALVLAGVLFVFSQRQQTLRASAVGLDGLQIWLSSEGIQTQTYLGGWPLLVADTGLLILPLYDTALDNPRTPATGEREMIYQPDERDLSTVPVLTKADSIPTMIVLPKWRSGLRLTGLAHPELLIDAQTVEHLLEAFTDADVSITRRDTSGFSSSDYRKQDGTNLEVLLYNRQTFTAPECTTVLGDAQGMLLGTCPLHNATDQQYVWILSDPDLLNNHGLPLGDNAAVAHDIADQLRDNRRVVIDYSNVAWLTRANELDQRERTWSDLARFVEPPFTLLWLGALLLMGTLLWRGGVRFGPTLRDADALGDSSTDALSARARLMRLSGDEGALAAEYARARLADTAAQLVGPADAVRLAGRERFLSFVETRYPQHGAALKAALLEVDALPRAAPSSAAMRAVRHLDDILEHITHDP